MSWTATEWMVPEGRNDNGWPGRERREQADLPGCARHVAVRIGFRCGSICRSPSPVTVSVLFPQQADAHGWEVRTPGINARPSVHAPDEACGVRAVENPDVASETAIRSPAETVGDRMDSSFWIPKVAHGACCVPLEGRVAGLGGAVETTPGKQPGAFERRGVVRLFRLGGLQARLRDGGYRKRPGGLPDHFLVP